MSFDEQPDPLSDALEAYDKLKKLCLSVQADRARLTAELEAKTSELNTIKIVYLATCEIAKKWELLAGKERERAKKAKTALGER